MQSKTKTVLRRIGITLLWSGALAGFMVLLIAAVKDKEVSRCKGISVTLKGDDSNAFIDEKDIRALVVRDKQQNPVGKPISEINIANLEKVVEADPWVRSAELFIDNREILNVVVMQRDPLARVFTFTGNSFYLDEQGERIPVSDRFTARVPVFTGYPSDAVKPGKEDSALFAQMLELARFVAKDTFWNAQVEQFVIGGDRKFEIVPKLGDHVIVFGDGTDIAKKFNKLLVFYKEGLNKVGWSTYSRINIAYDEEVIGTRRDGKSAPPPPMYRDSTIVDAVVDDDHTVAPPPKPAAKPKPAEKPKPAAKRGQKPKAIYNKPNHRN